MSLIILDQEYILGLENKGKWESEKTYTVGLLSDSWNYLSYYMYLINPNCF